MWPLAVNTRRVLDVEKRFVFWGEIEIVHLKNTFLLKLTYLSHLFSVFEDKKGIFVTLMDQDSGLFRRRYWQVPS